MIWTAIVVGAAGCYLLKLAGLSVPTRWLELPRVRQAAAVVPVALLAALVAVQVAADGERLVLDGRTVGLAAALVALVLRAPFLVVVAVAAAAAALVRLAL